MPMTAHDILHNADLFRAAYPNWPLSSPEREDPAEPVNPGGPSCGHPGGLCSCPTPAISAARLDGLDDDWRAEMDRATTKSAPRGSE